MKVYRIAKWTDYEKSDSKKCVTMSWVAVPINHTGLSFLEIMSRPDGLRMVGGWLLILQIAAQCPERGLLVSDSGRIIGAKEIALKTRANESDIKDCIATLLEFGWIEEVEVSGQHPDAIRTPSRLQNRTEQNNTEHTTCPADAELVGPSFAVVKGEVRIDRKFYTTMVDAYPTADIDGELSKAAAWCASASKKKTAGGIKRFINGWLNRNHRPAERSSTGPFVPSLTPDQIAYALEIESEAKSHA